MSTYLKHVEIVNFQATTKCDIFLDSLLKYKCTLKNSALYLLPFSRNHQKYYFVKVKRTIKLIHTNIRIIIPSICICVHVSIPGLLNEYH